MLADDQANLIVARSRAKLSSAMAAALMAEDDDRSRLEAWVAMHEINLSTAERIAGTKQAEG